MGWRCLNVPDSREFLSFGAISPIELFRSKCASLATQALEVGAISPIELFRSKCASLATRVLESAQTYSQYAFLYGQRTHMIVVRVSSFILRLSSLQNSGSKQAMRTCCGTILWVKLHRLTKIRMNLKHRGTAPLPDLNS